MIYPIVKYGREVLEKPANPVAEFDGYLEKLVADMFETMYAANGVGLAAPQIGLPLRLSVIDTTCGEDPKAKLVLANPVIVSTEGEQVQEEGCLSLPDFRAKTPRPERATVRAQDLHGQEFTLTPLQDFLGPHTPGTKYARCPHCGQRSWNHARVRE